MRWLNAAQSIRSATMKNLAEAGWYQRQTVRFRPNQQCPFLAESGHLTSRSACGRFCFLSAAAGTPFHLAQTRLAGGVSPINLLSGLKLLESLAELAEDELSHEA